MLFWHLWNMLHQQSLAGNKLMSSKVMQTVVGNKGNDIAVLIAVLRAL